MVTLQIIGPAFPDSFSASLLTALIHRSLFMPPISLPSFSINLSLPLSRKQRKSSDRMRSEGGDGPFISPQNSGNPPRSHLRLCSASLGRSSSRTRVKASASHVPPGRHGDKAPEQRWPRRRFPELVRLAARETLAHQPPERTVSTRPAKRSAFSVTPRASRI